jgi:Nif-specific regulatory protein
MSGYLILTYGTHTVRLEIGDARLTVGHAPDCAVVLSAEGVAALHAAVYRTDEAVIIEDLGGGLTIAGATISRQALRAGDVVALGSARLHYHAGAPDPVVQLSKVATDVGSLVGEIQAQRDAAEPAAPAPTRRLALLTQMASTIGADIDHRQVLDTLLAITFEALHPERAVLALVEKDGQLRFEATRQADGRADRVDDLQISSTILQRVVGSGEAFITADARDSDQLQAAHSVASRGIRSALCVPFRLRGRVAGALYVDHLAVSRAFDEQDLDFLVLLAHLASVAHQNVVDYQALRAQNEALLRETHGEGEIVGRSAVVRELMRVLGKVARSDQPVLIEGERGTGKELAARMIHRHSDRGRFVAVNCAAIPEALVESMLFGHERGAFTGAEKQHRGYFEQADGGTLFLDEIGDLRPPAQAAILRALQEREVRRVGGTQAFAVEVRIIAATNRDLAAAIDAGEFRGDLYDRLNVLPITLPPLRERTEDIEPLAAHFAAGRVQGISAKALQALLDYRWPGNIRELRNVIERAIVMGDGERIWPEDLSPALRGSAPERQHLPTLATLERDHIVRVLRHTQGNVARAARILAIRRVTVYAKLKSYGLNATDFKPDK